MSLAQLTERHGRAIVLATGLVAVAGLVSVRSLPSDIYPPLEFPRVIVVAHLGTVPGESMMAQVTRPIEAAIMEVPGIRRVRSTTFRGATEISAQFAPGTDIVLALQQVQNQVAELRSELPPDLDLTVERLTPAEFPMLSYNLSGGLSEADLHDYAFFVMRPALARVGGVGKVEVQASDQREYEVVVDPARLLATGLTMPNVADALKAENQLAPVGRYVRGGRQYLALASGLWTSPDDIARAPVVATSGATVRVGDLGTVFPGAPDRTVLVTGNGRPAAVVNVSQQLGARILDVRDGVEARLRDLAHSLPSGLVVAKVYDLAGFVEDAIGSVRDAIVVGGLLAVVVLYLFLRDLRVTAVAAITLPLTVVSTFLFMRFLGATINVMSMGGLAVAIGLVIDDAVVVVENIHRHFALRAGAGAVGQATSELVAPVVGSTITTVVVFAPLGLLSGVVGQFFRALSITLSVAVLISLVLALTLVPLLTMWSWKGGPAEGAARGQGLAHRYERILDRALRHPRRIGLAVGALAILVLVTFRLVPSGFLPHMDEGGFVIDYLTPPGTAIEETDRRIRRLEAILRETPEVAAFSRRTGSEMGIFATPANEGDVLVRLKSRGERGRSGDEVIDALRERVAKEVPGVEVEFVQLLQDMLGDLEGSAAPIEVKVFGDDPAVLHDLSERLKERLAQVPGLVDLVGTEVGGPEQTWQVDPAAAGRLGLTVEGVADQVQAALLGEVATQIRLGDRTVPVRVRYPDAVRFDPERVSATVLRGTDGRTTPLGALAHPVLSAGQPVLVRENLRQMALVTARLEGRALGAAVADVHRALAELALPVGYTTEVGGQYESQQEAFRQLLTVLAIAVSLVLLVLVVEFRSFVPALLILGAAPLSFGGGLLMLLVARTELNVSSAMGFILLVGLVVKNGIVMIDYAQRLEEGGAAPGDAIRTAASVRLRPILMTTLCTLFGLLPLALGWGAGAELQRPLALVVIGGLALSTAVTLFVVPVAYGALHASSDRA